MAESTVEETTVELNLEDLDAIKVDRYKGLVSEKHDFDKFSLESATLGKRENNEDAVGFGDGWVLVMDGLGGQIKGDKASEFVLEEMSKVLDGNEPANYVEVENTVHDSVTEIHKNLKAEFSGAATTMVLGRVFNREGKKSLFIASIGDSRAYLLRDGELKKITDDDNYNSREQALIIDDAKSMDDLDTEELQYAFKTRNRILSAIGGDREPGISPYVRDLEPGDRYIFATDGLFDNLTTREIEEISKKGGDIAKELVISAKSRADQGSFRSKQDDISVVVMEVK